MLAFQAHFMSMITPEIPRPQEVLADLAPILPAIHGALEDGVQHAREFFEERGVPVDPFLAPSLVRWRAKLYLEGTGRKVIDTEYNREDLSNNGLCLHFKNARRYTIRIRKSLDGTLPVPGPSRPMQLFYQQLAFAFVDPTDSGEDTGPLAVVLLWNVTSHYRLQPLQLACPKAGDLTRESVEAHWYIGVRHPALAVEGTPSGSQVDDLNISLNDPQDETGSAPA